MKPVHLKVLAVSGWAAWGILLGWTTLFDNIHKSSDRYRDRAIQAATRRFSTPGDGVYRPDSVIPFEIIESGGWSPAVSGFVKVRFRDGKATWDKTYFVHGDGVLRPEW